MFKKRGSLETGFFAKHRLLIAIATLVGTIMGAGILGMPYAIAKVGFLYGFILTIVIGLIFIFLNLFLGEIILRTKEQHQLTGYAEKYLGPWGKRIMAFSILANIYGALTAYLIGEGASFYAIIKAGSPVLYTCLFFLVGFLIVYRGMKTAGKAELLLMFLLFMVIIGVGVFSFGNIRLENYATSDLRYFLLPYGIIIFAFTGSAAIPEMQEVLVREKKKLKMAILIGSAIPIILYVLFSGIIVGIIGVEQFDLLEPNSRIATVALSLYAHPFLGIFANILAILTMFTSFLTLSIALSEVYQYDYGISQRSALFLTLIFPLLISLFNLTTFIAVLGVTGAIAGGLDGILIILMYWKAKLLGDRKPEYSLPKHQLIGFIIILLFASGILLQMKATLF